MRIVLAEQLYRAWAFYKITLIINKPTYVTSHGQDSFAIVNKNKLCFAPARCFMAAIVLILATLLAARRLSAGDVASKYRDLSENNRLQLRPIDPKRGLVFDRNGVILAENTLLIA